ncbi:MAG: DUF2759 domain-containing protein [Bacillus sp. (in: firmicutes)]
MGLVVIFAFVTMLAALTTIKTLKTRNVLGLLFSAGTLVIFGWFSIMTAIHHGVPVAH